MSYFPRAKTIRFNEVRTTGPGVGYYSVPPTFCTRGPATFLRAKRWKDETQSSESAIGGCCRHCGCNVSIAPPVSTYSSHVLTTSTPAQRRSNLFPKSDVANFSTISHIAPLQDPFQAEPKSPSKQSNCTNCFIFERQLDAEVSARRALEDRLMNIMHTPNYSFFAAKDGVNQSLMKIQEQNDILQDAASQLASLANACAGGHEPQDVLGAQNSATNNLDEDFVPAGEMRFEREKGSDTYNRRLTFSVASINPQLSETGKSIGNMDSFCEDSSDEELSDNADEIASPDPVLASPEKSTSKASNDEGKEYEKGIVCENCSNLETELLAIRKQLLSIQNSSVPTDTYLRLERELKQTKEFLDSLEKELDTGNGNEEVDAERNDDEGFREEMKSSMQVLREHVHLTVDQLTSANREAEMVKMSNEQLRNEVNRLLKDLDNHVSLSENLKEQLTGLRRMCCEHLRENKELQDSLIEALGTSSDLNQSRKEALGEMNMLKDELESLAIEHDDLRKAKRDIEKEKETLEDRNSNLEEKLKEFAEKVEEYEGVLETYQEDIAWKDGEIDRLSSRVEDLKTEISKQKQEFVSEVEELKAQIEFEKLETQKKMSESRNNYDIVLRKNEELNTCLKKYQSAIKNVLTQIENIEAPEVTLDNVNDVNKVFEDLKVKVTKGEAEINSLVEKFKEKETDYESKVSQLRQQVNVLTSKSTVRECEFKALDEEKNRLFEEKKELQRSLENRDHDLYVKMSQAERLVEEVKTLEQTIDNLKTREGELLSEVNNWDKKFRSVSNNFNLEKQELNAVRLELNDSVAIITDLRFEKQNLLEQNAKFKQDVVELNEVVDSLRDELEKKDSDLSYADNELNELRNKLSSVTSELEMEKNINDSLAQKTDEAHSEIEKLTEKVEQLEYNRLENLEREKDSEQLFISVQSNLEKCKEELIGKTRECEELKLLLEEANERSQRRDSMNGKVLAEVEIWKSRMNEAEEKLKNKLGPIERENRLLFEKVHELQLTLREYEEMTDYQDYKSSYEKVLRDMEYVSSQVDAKNEKLEKQRELIVTLEGKLMSREFQLNAALSENQKKSHRVSALEKIISEKDEELSLKVEEVTESFEGKIAAMKREQLNLRDEIVRANESMEQSKKDLDGTLAKLLETEKEKEEIRTILEVKKKSNEEISRKIFELIRGITKLELKVNQKSVEDNLRSEELGDVLSELDSSRDCLGQFEQYINEQAMLIQDKEREILSLTRKLNETNEQLQLTMDRDVENFEPSYEFAKWQEMYDSLSAEKRTLEKSYNELKLSVEPFKDLLNQYDTEKKLLLQKTLSTEQQYSDLVDRYADLLGHQNQKQKIKHLNKLKSENLRLKKENEELRDDMKKLHEELKSFVHNDVVKYGGHSTLKAVNKSGSSNSTKNFTDVKSIKAEFDSLRSSRESLIAKSTSSESLVLKENRNANIR